MLNDAGSVSNSKISYNYDDDNSGKDRDNNGNKADYEGGEKIAMTKK